MAYSTAAEVKVVLQGFIDPLAGQDPDYTAAKLSDAQIEYEIGNADEQINSVLRRRYSLPLPLPVPAILKFLSIDIAAALCDQIYRGSREYASDLSPARLRYERAKEILNSIATGDYPLYNTGEGPEETGDTSIVLNPYKGDVLLTKEVFPRGYLVNGSDGEYGQAIIPQPWHYRSGY